MKLFLLACLAFGAIVAEKGISGIATPRETYSCQVKNGNILMTANGERIPMNLPCKYNAIRNTVCGDYRITITPGNEYDSVLEKYVINTIWVGVEDLEQKLEWEGRSSVNQARKFLHGELDDPFVKKDGYLQTDDIFCSESGRNPDYVTLRETNDQFKIDFRLDSDGKEFGFKFTCFSDSTSPSDYPKQICGNGYDSIPDETTLLTNIFGMKGLAQPRSSCEAAANALQRCERKHISIRSAIEKCGPILSRRHYYTKIAKDNANSIISAFRHCAEFVCSNYEDLDSCLALKEELSESPRLPEVSNKLEEVCDQPPNLDSEEDQHTSPSCLDEGTPYLFPEEPK